MFSKPQSPFFLTPQRSIQLAASNLSDHVGVGEASEVVRLTPVEEAEGSTATVEVGGLQLLNVSPRKAAPTRERDAAVKRLVLPSFIES
jgi:hypothetical protein